MPETAIVLSKQPQESEMSDEPTKPDRPWQDRVSRRTAIVVLVAVVAAIAATTAFLVNRDSGLPEDAAFAVGDDVVDTEEVETRMKALQALYGIQRPTEDGELASFRKDTAKSMAVELLLRREADEADIVIPEKRVQDMTTALVEQRYPDGGRAAFVQALGDLGASEQQVLDEIEQQLLVARLFDHVTRDVEVSDTEVREEFTERRGELGTPERRKLGNIVVSTRGQAVRVLTALRAGAPFAAVAARSSLDSATRDKGGNLGTVAASQLATAYARAAFGAVVGQTFGPVRTKHGWNVGLVKDAVPPRPAAYAAVKDMLRTMLIGEKALEVWTDWLSGLIRDADVEYADDFRPADPDAVPDMSIETPAPAAP